MGRNHENGRGRREKMRNLNFSTTFGLNLRREGKAGSHWKSPGKILDLEFQECQMAPYHSGCSRMLDLEFSGYLLFRVPSQSNNEFMTGIPGIPNNWDSCREFSYTNRPIILELFQGAKFTKNFPYQKISPTQPNRFIINK